MANQRCLAAVLGGAEYCRHSGSREVASEVVNYDVSMAGSARHHRSPSAFLFPESWNQGIDCYA